MYPFCLTLDERQSIEKRTGRREKQQPTGKPIVPQPERLNEILPATEEVGDCTSEEEGGNGEERRSLQSRAKGSGYATARSPLKAQPLLNPALLELDASQRNAGPRTAAIFMGEPPRVPHKNPRDPTPCGLYL